ncbi:MAG: tetratricopeptide repeat protein [Candidatus Atribacteria bacterium]|nr:tetratricopeptide repeat protein [Candidatus Atribacteria bacterium]
MIPIRITGAFLVFILWIFLLTPLSVALEAIDRAELLLEEGKNEEAIAILEPLLQSNDEEELARVTELLYRIYDEKGEDQKAIQALETYIQKFPGNPTSYLYLYWIAKFEEERGHIDRYLELLRRLIDTYPADSDFEDPYELRVQAQEDIAYAFQNYTRDYPQAIKAYQELLNYIEEEEKPRIMMEIALCYEKMKKLTEATNEYQKVVQQSQDEFYRRWAQLRVQYLTEKPSTVEKSPESLAQKLMRALEKRDLKALEQLAKRGDFWAGVNFSEFEIDEFQKAKEYLAQYLTSSPQLKVAKTLQKKNDELLLRLENWGDPNFNILYFVLDQGIYGWEWKGIILSSTALEELSEDIPHPTD